MYNIQEGIGIPVKADYYFYGVYPATDEQVPDFTLRFSSLLLDAKEVKTVDPDYTSNNVTREVILTDEDFVLTDALGDKFYLFNGVKADGSIDLRSEMNRRQGFEEDTEGFAQAFTLAGNVTNITAKDAKGNAIGVTKGTAGMATVGADGTITVPTGVNAGFYENTLTKTNGWAAGAVDGSKIILTDLPAKQANKPAGFAAVPGGVMIQLPATIGTTEPITINFELVDVFGATKTLSVTVKAAK